MHFLATLLVALAAALPSQARGRPAARAATVKLAGDGAYNGTIVRRVVRDGIIHGGDPLTKDRSNQAAPLTERQQTLVHRIVSMARGDDPASATTSFFIVTADAPSLDGKYTAFGRVIDGLDVLDRIESTPVSGESPTTRIDLIRVRLVG
jgi:peptidyl-prolyl cis-trans isomerase B (cyclophilin B)